MEVNGKMMKCKEMEYIYLKIVIFIIAKSKED
jgi:hypothetical protein